jgi:hypothetical protein
MVNDSRPEGPVRVRTHYPFLGTHNITRGNTKNLKYEVRVRTHYY